jgi:hypothetical protein
MENPFNITKANDYSDNDIQKYWVDFFGDKEKIKPNSPTPILIKGSKGCGKTHLLKYFSYELQKIREKDIMNILLRDKYIGVFMRCSGLNSDRFRGKGIEDDRWNDIFSYYLDLWFGQKIISILLDFQINLDVQKSVSNEIILLFDKYDDFKVDNFVDLLNLLKKLQKNLDYEIKNIGFRRNEKPNFDLLLNTGTLIYGIPKIISRNIVQFKDVFFLYIIDEFENITISQQKIFNALYRERDFPGSFRIGGRLYGFKTFETLGSSEENREGGEYEVITLDEDRRNEEQKYYEFLIEICIKKLENNNFGQFTKDMFLSYFENFQEEIFLKEISTRAERLKDNHIKSLRNELKLIKIQMSDVEEIICNLSFENNKLIEKAKYLNFYREWKKGRNLLEISREVKKSAEEYIEAKDIKKNSINIILDYFKFDLLDQLAREASLEIETYVDIENYVKMSAGSPRNFLNIIKQSYDYEFFKQNNIPFLNGNKISLDSQLKAIKKVSEWFYDINRMPFETKYNSYPIDLINDIGNYLRNLKFSNTPPQCSINVFTIESSFINKHNDIFENLLNYSYLIKSGDRRGNNDDKKETAFYINGIIASHYELSIHKRGVVKLSTEIIDAFLQKNESIINKKLKNYNAPFREITNTINFTDE